MKSSVEKASFDEQTRINGVNALTFTPQRHVILNSLWDDAELLTSQINKKRIKTSPIRLQMIKTKAYICSILLSGLKDYELDLIMKEIETIKKQLGARSNVNPESTTRSKIH